MFRMKNLILAACSIAAALAVITFLSPEAFAASTPLVSASASLFPPELKAAAFVLAVGLDALRAQHSTLVAAADAKIKEVKDGMAADAVAKIEGEHTTLLDNIKAVMAAITSEEAKPPVAGKAWAAGFYASAGETGLTIGELNTIVASAATHDAAKDALIAALAKKRDTLPGPQGISIGMDARDKFVTGVTASIVAKVAGLDGGERNEFSGRRMFEIARMSLEITGRRDRFRDDYAMLDAAFAPVVMGGQLSSSDFTNILANVANKSMLKGYDEAPETFREWTSRGVLSDFKAVSRVDLGLFPNLDKVEEGAEYKSAKLTDRGITVALATYGKLFPITRQAIINDDLNAFTKVPRKMGFAAHRTVGNLVYAILTSNPAINGAALFHASHKNLLTGASSAMSADSLDAGRSLMAKQQDADKNAVALNIRPAFLLAPVALEGKALQLIASQTEPGQANPGVANRVAKMAKVVAEARLDVASTTSWYLAGSPAQYDTIEVSYLNGVEAPTLEQKEGWHVDGVEFKVRHDAGVNLLDHIALLKADGA